MKSLFQVFEKPDPNINILGYFSFVGKIVDVIEKNPDGYDFNVPSELNLEILVQSMKLLHIPVIHVCEYCISVASTEELLLRRERSR